MEGSTRVAPERRPVPSMQVDRPLPPPRRGARRRARAARVRRRARGPSRPELLLSAGVTFVRALGGLAGYAFAAGRALTPRRLSGRAWAHVAGPGAGGGGVVGGGG